MAKIESLEKTSSVQKLSYFIGRCHYDWKCWNCKKAIMPCKYQSYSQFERTVFWGLFGCCQVWSTWNLQNFITTFTREKFWLAETKGLRRKFFLWFAKSPPISGSSFPNWDHLRYAPLFGCPLLSSKSDSPLIKILEGHSLKQKNNPRFWMNRGAYCIHIEITCYKISTLETLKF